VTKQTPFRAGAFVDWLKLRMAKSVNTSYRGNKTGVRSQKHVNHLRTRFRSKSGFVFEVVFGVALLFGFVIAVAVAQLLWLLQLLSLLAFGVGVAVALSSS